MNSQLYLDFLRFRMNPLRESDTADSPDSFIFSHQVCEMTRYRDSLHLDIPREKP